MSRHSLTIALLICMTTAAVAAECAPPNVPSETDAKRQVVQLDDEWLQAELRHDAVTLDRILDDKFVATFGGKKTYDRATFIKAITTGPADPTETQSLDRELVIIEGDTARGLVGGSTFRRTPISRSPLDKNPMPGHLSELQPVNAVNTKGQFFRDRKSTRLNSSHHSISYAVFCLKKKKKKKKK